jgi:hypothetical protein
VPVLAEEAARRTMWPWWLGLLLLLVLLGFLLPWFAAPLLAALARPDSGFCAIPPDQRQMIATIDSEQGEEAALRRELTFVESIIAERAAQCHAPTQTARNDRLPPPLRPREIPPDRPPIDVPVVPGIGGTHDTPGIDVPGTPGIDVPRPDVATPDHPDTPDRTDMARTDPPRPDQRPDATRPDQPRTNPPRPDQRDQARTDPPRPDQRTPTTNPPRPDQRQQASVPRPEDITPRLQREHVQEQEVNVALAWNTQDDLDIVVACPNNQQISYRSPQSCSGQLDVDMNRSDPRSDTPVENISIPHADAAPRGRYRVQIDNQSSEAVPYRVRVTVRGESHEYTGTVPPHAHGHRVTEFDLPSGRAAQ